MTDDEYNRYRNEEQQLIDQILDKIAKNGYKSLTNKEKEILFKSGNKSSWCNNFLEKFYWIKPDLTSVIFIKKTLV